MHTIRSAACSALLLLCTSGCDVLPTSEACDLIALPGISVQLVDAATNGPILQGAVEVRASTGAFADTVRLTAAPVNYNVPVSLAHERVGMYRLEVAAEGYALWAFEGVRVDLNESGCHVETRRLTARLQPL